jgi:dCTP deaminase
LSVLKYGFFDIKIEENTLLIDREIDRRLSAQPPIATEVALNDFTSAKSKVQAASLNLTIGEIYVPGTDPNKSGGANMPKNEFTLQQGSTAVIKTAETLHLGPRLSGIAFPPATLSLKGLLTTNPGHIDPGYSGPLHITVINMSRVPFSLRAGDRIMRVLFLELAGDPTAPFNVRNPGTQSVVITPALLDQLSVDFLDVEKRSGKIAKSAVKKAAFFSIAIPIVVAALSVAGTILAGNLLIKDELKKMDVRLSLVEDRQSNILEKRLRSVEDSVLTFQTKGK